MILRNQIRTSTIVSSLILLLVQAVVAKEIDSKQDLQQEESIHLPAEHRSYLPPPSVPLQGQGQGTKYGPQAQISRPGEHNDPWPLGRPDMPQIKSLNVKCEKNHMKVNMEFDRPFYGMIFSKGHYSDPKCVHLPPGSGHLLSNFEIFLGGCGMQSSEHGAHGGGASASGLFIENTIIIQYDPQVQEIWDQARRLRCTWYDYYEKAVTFRPFNVDMLDAVTANFLGDNIQCWMQIQVGKGPWASEVAGIVKIGQTMTMVLAIKDDENKFDMLVRSCIAHDGKHQPIQLVDEYGCVVRPKIMSRFQKVKNFGHSATVVSYAYFQAFKFPDSMNVHFQCVIQVCRHECPEPSCDGDGGGEYLPAPRDPSAATYTDVRPTYALPPAGSKPPTSPNNKPVYKPAPKVNIFPNKVLINRQGEMAPVKGDDSQAGDYALSLTGGMPRALQLDPKRRRKRDSHMEGEVKDIRTQKIIQVVAPGDVAFALSSSENETVVDNSNIFASQLDLDDNSICLSMAGFAAGLVFLLLLLILSCLVAAFLYLRVRHFTSIGLKCTESVLSYENPEFLKLPSLASLASLHIATTPKSK